jgi:hypothetical protein
LGALVFPLPRIAEFRAAFESPFARFKNEGGERLKKLHITEAFQPGNEDLRPMALEVRDTIFHQVKEKRVLVIYSARRMMVLREGHAGVEQVLTRVQQLKAQASGSWPKHIAISNSNRPSEERIDQDLVMALTLLLDSYAIHSGMAQIDVATDEMDLPVAAGLNERIDEARSISFLPTIVKTFDLTARKPIVRTITFRVTSPPFELDVKHVGRACRCGQRRSACFRH